MVDYQQLWDCLDRLPREPFRVVTTDGEIMDVFRRGEAAANKRWFIFAKSQARAVRFSLEQLERIEPLQERSAS